LRHVPRHVAVSVGHIVLPTQDVYAVDLRLQRQQRLRRDHRLSAVSGVSESEVGRCFRAWWISGGDALPVRVLN
jgi:hypothetical protein